MIWLRQGKTLVAWTLVVWVAWRESGRYRNFFIKSGINLFAYTTTLEEFPFAKILSKANGYISTKFAATRAISYVVNTLFRFYHSHEFVTGRVHT